MASALGHKLRNRRKKLGLTLEDLAALSKTSKSYLWELENRDVTPRPSAEKLGMIFEKIGVTIESIWDDEGEVSVE